VTRGIIGALFIISLFVGIAMFRGMGLGRDYDPVHIIALFLLAAITFVIFHWMGKKSDENEK
jgi:hypothetical protein